MSDLSIHAPVAAAYSKPEEAANALTHGIGAIASIFASIVLVRAALPLGKLALAAYSIFGASLILLFSASTLYHAATEPEQRRRLRRLDHSSIYVLIAGTYSAYCLTVLRGPLGWTIFAAVWLLALCGIGLQLFFLGRFRILSTVGYVAMGWIIVFAFGALKQRLSFDSVALLLAGGIAYTVGSIFYAVKRLPWSHPIFHLFVLAGAACHVVSVLKIA